jgi:hypothetical protein
MNHRRADRIGGFLKGILLTIVGHIGLLILVVAMSALFAWIRGPKEDINWIPLIPYILLAFIGISQMAYIIPLWVFLKPRSSRAVRNGLVSGAILTLLVNCFFVIKSWSVIQISISFWASIAIGIGVFAALIALIGIKLIPRKHHQN